MKILSSLVKKYPSKATHALYRLTCKGSGLVRHTKDHRDFETGIFNWGSYEPKQQKKRIKTLSVKNQMYNTCQWNATCVQKEVDEGVPLSARSIVAWGVKNGLVSGDGFSNLPSGQKALKNWGIAEEHSLPEQVLPWSSYANIDLARHAPEADRHKTKSYWSVSSRNDILKLLDDGRPITTGIDWYTGFNQGGGFGSPWLIEKAIGYRVGGHAVTIVGYDLGYHGKSVYIIQNSYSTRWGDKGDFYITMDYLDRNNYGFYTNLDIVPDVAGFLNQFREKNVKGSSSAIYYIVNGTKRPYPNWETYLAYNGKTKGFTLVDDELLRLAPTGEMMDIKATSYWEFLKDVEAGNRLPALLELLSRNT